jgi:hypothetical protein
MPTPLVNPLKETKCHEAILFQLPPDRKEKFLKRYWANIDVGGPKDCWEFEGTLTSNGYGRILGSYQKISFEPRTHRLAWVIRYNTLIPKGLLVCHRCDNKVCCNPEHLFLGTIETNLADRDLKKRCGGKWRNGGYLSIPTRKKIIIECLSSSRSVQSIAKKHKVAAELVISCLNIFFKKIKDKSWLPELLRSRYDGCKSWKDVRTIRDHYAREDANNGKI